MFKFYTLLFILYLEEYSTLSTNYDEEIKQICTSVCNKYVKEIYIECLNSCF